MSDFVFLQKSSAPHPSLATSQSVPSYPGPRPRPRPRPRPLVRPPAPPAQVRGGGAGEIKRPRLQEQDSKAVWQQLETDSVGSSDPEDHIYEAQSEFQLENENLGHH